MKDVEAVVEKHLETRQRNLIEEHWITLRDGLRDYDRPYGRSKDVYQHMGEPEELSTYELGHALSGLSELEIIDVFSKNPGQSALYDFRDYDQDRLIDTGIALTMQKYGKLDA